MQDEVKRVLDLFIATSETPYPPNYHCLDFLQDALQALGEPVQRIADERTAGYDGLLVRNRALVWFLDNRLPHLAAREDAIAAQILAQRSALVLHTQKRDAMRVGGYWLPLAVTPGYARVITAKCNSDLAFVGYVRDTQRAAALEYLLKHNVTINAQSGIFPPYANAVYATARAALNIPTLYGDVVCYDVNMRVFEAPACGALLLTNSLPELAELGFMAGVNCLTYNDLQGVLDAVQWLRDAANAQAIQRIKAAGRAWVLAKHTYAERARQVLRYIEMEAS